MRIVWRKGPPRILASIKGPNGKSLEVISILDTGADVVLISRDICAHLGYDLLNAPETRLCSASGTFSAPKLKLLYVGVQNYVAEGVEAVCADFPSVKAQALLGLSWINNFKVTFDKKSEQILIE